MKIGIPSEIKTHEYRVGLTPASAHELSLNGHEVYIQRGAGLGAGYSDEEYTLAGAQIVDDAPNVFDAADLIIKVKEPQAIERKLLTPKHTLFTYLHLAPDRAQTVDLIDSGATCIAYETVTDQHGRLPLLAPMSEVAGRMSIQAGAYSLEKENGGRGVLLGGVPGVPPAEVLVLGAGVVGSNAIKMAVGAGARVTVLDTNINALRELDNRYGNKITTIISSQYAIAEQVQTSDLIIGAVLIPGAAAPKLITREHLLTMKPGAALVDVAIDQGGCFETSRPTTHDQPTYIIDDIVHYCVANMPGAVSRTSTQALNNATLPFISALANQGILEALRSNIYLRQGLNVYQSKLCCPSVGRALDINSQTPEQALQL
jgi:alanine dehydrogenase